MIWYNILNPRSWPGVKIETGNKKIDGNYYNLLSSKHVSLAASGSMFLAANSGIKLISPSFVDASGIRATNIFAETFGRIDLSGNIIPLYSGAQSGLVFKNDDNTLISSDIITYDGENNTIRFPSANPGNPLYITPSYIQNGVTIDSNNALSSFEQLVFMPQQTDAADPPNVISPATITANSLIIANSGINLGPNNDLDSYQGFILTHAGSGEPAEWKPATYLRENYDTTLQMEGLERIGVNWIRYPKRPGLIRNGRLYLYQAAREWSPYPPISASVDAVAKELGVGEDTICVETSKGDIVVGYTKLAFVAKASSQQKLEASYDFTENIKVVQIIDPDDENPNPSSVSCFEIEIAPETPAGIGQNAEGQNVFVFSVTQGGYFPMQLEPEATTAITLDNQPLQGTIEAQDDGVLLDNPLAFGLTFKPSTLNNISIRPGIHTAFNMLGENIDFIIYGKEYTEFNRYTSIFDLDDNFIPSARIPIFRAHSTIENSVSGSPSGVIYSKFIDREKTSPIGWSFDRSGKVCIKTNDPYVLGTIPNGDQTLSSHADVTISGITYSNSIITEDIFLRPKPQIDNTGKYIRNALLTINSEGQIVSRTPRINPTVPDRPSGVMGAPNGNGGFGNNQHSIQWTAPGNDGRSRIINYLIQLSFNNGENWIDLPTDTILVNRGFATQTSATIDQVASAAIFRVAAQNNIGISEYSEATDISFVSNTDLPQSPTNLNVFRNIDSIELSDINISWTPTNSWGAFPASGYELEESSDNGLSWFKIASIPYDSPASHNETGLDGVTNYLYRISSVNSNNGRSAYAYVYSTGLVLQDPDLEEEENKKQEELSNFDFGVILFTGICEI